LWTAGFRLRIRPLLHKKRIHRSLTGVKRSRLGRPGVGVAPELLDRAILLVSDIRCCYDKLVNIKDILAKIGVQESPLARQLLMTG